MLGRFVKPAPTANVLRARERQYASYAYRYSFDMSQMNPIAASKCITLHWHEMLVQETGCVVFKGSLPLPECCNDIATDVTSIAVPMAFCRGVNEQPVSSENIKTTMMRDMSVSFVDASVQLQIFYGVMQLTEQRNNG